MTPSPAQKLLPYLRPYRRQFLGGLACAFGASLASLMTPWILQHAIDALIARAAAATLGRDAALLLGLTALAGALRFTNRRLIIGASRDVERDVRTALFAHLHRLDLAYFRRARVGDLMSRATNDLNAVRMMLGPALMFLSMTTVTFIAGVVLMVRMDPALAAVALLPLPLVSLAAWALGKRIHQRFGQIQAQFSEVSAIVQEMLVGVRVVRAYRQESFAIARFARANEEYVRRMRSLIALQALYLPSIMAIMGMGTLAVLWFGSRAVIAHRRTVGEFVAFLAYLTLLAWPMVSFGWINNLVQRGLASWRRILQVLDTVPAIAERPDAAGLLASASVEGTIELRHLTFTIGDRPVLRDISTVVPAGTTAAILGATGAGKSMLLDLVSRVHEPPAGTIFLDGVDVRTLPLSTLRATMGVVPQEPFLFSTTVAENIAFGAGGDDVGRGRVEGAAAFARLDADLGAFPQGYDTVVGERGMTVSGGQKQRVAIARALIHDPRILLLDDALSAVDVRTAEEILARLRTLSPRRTCLVVSHRVATVRDADQILVLDDGCLVERGTHQELLARDGAYARLHRQQQQEAQLAAL